MTSTLAFYTGLHQPSDAKHFQRVCLSVNRLRPRRRPVGDCEVLVDSGAFTELEQYGRYRHSVGEHAAELRRIHCDGVARIVAAVAQDYMCEPFMLAKTGLTIADHQRLTIERYDALRLELGRLFPDGIPFHVLPVIQGYTPQDYVDHVRAYGDRLASGMWAGVGSVCKRNTAPEEVVAVLAAIKSARPDLLLHGFGVKLTALTHPGVRELLYSADSLAWSFSARKQGRNGNCWTEAKAFERKVYRNAGRLPAPWQVPLPL